MLDIKVANRMEDQLLTLLNMSTEEYDQFLDHQHQKLYRDRSNIDTLSMSLESQYIWNEINDEKTKYIQSIKELRSELDIMKGHRKGLEEKLEMITIKESEDTKSRKASVVFAGAKMTGNKSLLNGLENAYELSSSRKTDQIPYASQDRILSRFSCMLYTAADKRAWIELEMANYCDSCAEK
ncbi:unnamed protein product, partial [Didymodactylos carnosus]